MLGSIEIHQRVLLQIAIGDVLVDEGELLPPLDFTATVLSPTRVQVQWKANEGQTGEGRWRHFRGFIEEVVCFRHILRPQRPTANVRIRDLPSKKTGINSDSGSKLCLN